VAQGCEHLSAAPRRHAGGIGIIAGVNQPPSALFKPEDGMAYLDSATYGLPPLPTIDAMSRALAQWQSGSAYWIDDWDVVGERGRAAFAELIGVPQDDVSLIPAASVGVGTVAAALTSDDRVVVPDDEFTSLLFPLLVAEEQGTVVTQVPFIELAERIEPGTTLVATSLVQMQTGRVAPLESILDRAEAVGARVLVDATHGIPFVGMGGIMARADYVVCAAYKHLLCPRGVAFLVVGSERQGDLAPWNANWRAASDPYGRYFGGPLTLAAGAARFDVSIAWLPWIGGAVSLELLCEFSAAGLLESARALARELAGQLGVTWGGSSIVCVPVTDLDAAKATLDEAHIKVGLRGDGVRLSTHVYTTGDDVERAVAVLQPLVTR
jgi:selenocysteine lyase/cysteine desulfurase